MRSTKSSLDRDYFDRVYDRDADPWHFETSAYEREKYDATIALLGDRRFASGFEIGCSIGVLTSRLAGVCDRLLSVDINERALVAARKRCAAIPQVTFAQMTVPRDFPAGRFDLVVVSEVAYYWSDDDLNLALDRIAASARGGMVELVHFLPPVADYVRGGDAVHAWFLADPRFVRLRHRRTERYRIDILAVT
jgi:SAM-dependent methyltransferase